MEEQIDTVWDRYEDRQPQCGFGSLGLCCRNCSMGPCRIDPFGNGPQMGICGADANTITARNIARMIAGGAAAHSDHGRDIAHTLLLISRDPNADYKVKDPHKLKAVAEIYGIETSGRELKQTTADTALAALNEFGRAEGALQMAATAPPARAYRKSAALSGFPRCCTLAPV